METSNIQRPLPKNVIGVVVDTAEADDGPSGKLRTGPWKAGGGGGQGEQRDGAREDAGGLGGRLLDLGLVPGHRAPSRGGRGGGEVPPAGAGRRVPAAGLHHPRHRGGGHPDSARPRPGGPPNLPEVCLHRRGLCQVQ